MSTTDGSNSCFASPQSSGWAVLTVLLLRKDLDPAGKLAFFRTCRTAAELVPCLATSPLRLALNKAQARLSPYTAKLLASLAASASTNSETAGTDVHLTVLGASQHSLPKDSITVVTLQDAAFTQQQWQEFRDSLPQYPRLRSVRLRGRNWAVSDTDTSTNLDLEQTTATTPSPIYVPVLEVMDDEEVMSHIRRLGLCYTSLTTKAMTCVILPLAARLYDSIATSAKHVTITIPSLDCVTEEPISHPDSKEWTQPPAWQSLTLAGMVRYALIGRLPIKPLTKVTIQGHLYTEAALEYSKCDKALSALPNLRFAPVPNTSPALHAAGKGQCPTLHLHHPEKETMELILGRLSTDVECLTLHGSGGSTVFDPVSGGSTALDRSHIDAFCSDLPAHVTTICFRLDSTQGTADILYNAPRAIDNPGQFTTAQLELHNALTQAVQLLCAEVLAKLPLHVKVVCVEVVNSWAAGEERITQWQRLLKQLAGSVDCQPKSTELILANVLPGAGTGLVADPAPESLAPWLPEEQTALHQWCKDKSWGGNTVFLRLV